MGMYTGLRGLISLKEEFKDPIKNMINTKLNSDFTPWDKVLGDTAISFQKDARNTMIPFGNVIYMPDDWKHVNSLHESGLWNISCSLKDYDSTIKNFIDNVLPVIAKSWVLEEFYEEWTEGKFYSSSSRNL